MENIDVKRIMAERELGYGWRLCLVGRGYTKDVFYEPCGIAGGRNGGVIYAPSIMIGGNRCQEMVHD